MKNYYDILEVNESASTEVIEKVYKVLVKKYHPDTNPDDKKEWAENMFKEISEAYEILSDPLKREEYDKKLKNDFMQETIKKQQSDIKNQNNYSNIDNSDSSIYYTEEEVKDKYESNNSNNIQYDTENLRQELEYQRQKAYNDAYYKALKDMGYTIKYKKSFKDYVIIFIFILVLFCIAMLLWIIPYTRLKLIDLYENTPSLKFIIDLIKSIISKIKY